MFKRMPVWVLAALSVALMARCAPEPQPQANQPLPAPKVQGLLVPYISIEQPAAKKPHHVFHGEQAITIEKPQLQLAPLLSKFAKYKDESIGYAGWVGDWSENVLTLHVAAQARGEDVWTVISAAAEAGIYKLAVGTPELISSPLTGPHAPDFEKLPTGYLKAELPQDEGLSTTPSIPKERVSAYIQWDVQRQAAHAVVAIDARGRKVVEGTFTAISDIIAADGDSRQASDQRKARRENWVTSVTKAVEDYIGKSGADIEKVQLGSAGARTADDSPPWIFVDLTWQALARVNANRISAGKKKLEIVLPSHMYEPTPPPPEMPREREVEYPKDEPEREYPTEDDRIVEDAKDEVNEDPSDSPNRDLGDNTGKRPKDGDSSAPDKDDPASAFAKDQAAKPSEGYSHRTAKGGGGRPHDNRVLAALTWLKDHQNFRGHWSATTFSDDSRRANAAKTYNIDWVSVGAPDGDKGWESSGDIGLTGLALLAFAGAGNSHLSGDFKETIRYGMAYLKKVQSNDGCFGAKEDDHFVYNHAIATMAMAEIFGLSGDTDVKPIADKAVEFILKAQNPGMGWRYGVQPGVNDSSVTGWMVMALKSAKTAGLDVDTSKSFSDAADWFKMVTVDVNGYPKTGYDAPGSNNARLRNASDYEHNPSMDAIYITSMLWTGKADLNDRVVKSLARVCVEQSYLPTWDRDRVDYYYWYMASMALYQVGGSTWAAWEKAMSRTLLDNQRGWHATDKRKGHITKDILDEHGSWDAVDAWGQAGGRVYSTAINCLTLQTYYRYLKLPEKD
ncbi:MAG: terpene cyclase/mutase family protein [Planctomycetes bacterium]|nr:terpene cyclase/mutase family protein [Planctomycetota bacterium]